jgi:uncharacterized membrane protein YfbV (UPF0208 family)
MRKPIVASLLSALVFPGLGLWYLGYFTIMLLFAVPALFALVYLVQGVWNIGQTVIYNRSQEYIDQVFREQNWHYDWLATFHEIKLQLDQVPELYQSQWILFCAWSLGIATSFWLGLRDPQTTSRSQTISNSQKASDTQKTPNTKT